MNSELINYLTATVLQEQIKQPLLSIEAILNSAGVCGISAEAMLEIRAGVYRQLGRGLTPDNELSKALRCFVFDYPVFRWSELRFYFIAEPKHVLTDLLKEFKYKCRHLSGHEELVWAHIRMWNVTARHQLAHRDRVGDKAYFDFLNYQGGAVMTNQLMSG
ncbi:hypothetical protein SG34_030650 [Thalassomonas viridans]|uniref:Uncharacterized protein n=1 Tax=Thalassomonas viridans TaxID=137584 RepID=A0AAE9ZEP4_9GAMM|nr:hypothetical protein [Thalassomonas viridans]WDE09128.1 hypothetical protein SG34_030650 [Thalassomonas viridans]